MHHYFFALNFRKVFVSYSALMALDLAKKRENCYLDPAGVIYFSLR